MSWEYCCPQCKAMLNPDRSIILTIQRGDVRALVGLHPQPGKYEVHVPPGISIVDGTKWDFSCPVCQASLAHLEDPNLSELELQVEGEPLRIVFSQVAGELATFVIGGGTLKEKHGKDAGRYDLHWGQTKYLV